MAEDWEKYKVFDHPAIQRFLFYPRRDDYEAIDSETVLNLDLSVNDDIKISCSFFFVNKTDPNLLFFHGNGELASEYMDIGAAFNHIGMNLFVADYRGYGRSGGKPSVSSMIKDAQGVLEGFKNTLKDRRFTGSHFIMGRSLGSASAIELASGRPDEFKGLIVESGFCDVTDLLARIGLKLQQPGQSDFVSPGFESVTKISMPVLVIHGQYDSIVPLTEGEKIYRNAGSRDKKMVIILGADHNTIFAEGMGLYLKELGFVNRLK
ncbi:MAG: alpha/beta fold hydrolase [Dehalococcoidia bacterium]|jgi:alpha-beta hydrolase superfamily lysophospholipase